MNVDRIINDLYNKIQFLEDSKMMCNRFYVSRAYRLIDKLRNHKQ